MAKPLDVSSIGGVVQALVSDWELAIAQYRIYQSLRHAVAKEYRAASDLRDLVWFMLNAHRDAAVHHLCRLYDSEPKSVSLRTLIQISSAKKGLVRRRKDLHRVSPKSRDVKRLIVLRHNLFAHRSPEAVRDGPDRLLRENALEVPAIQRLLTKAGHLIRDYGGVGYIAQQIPKDSEGALVQLWAMMRFLENATFDGTKFSRAKWFLDGVAVPR